MPFFHNYVACDDGVDSLVCDKKNRLYLYFFSFYKMAFGLYIILQVV